MGMISALLATSRGRVAYKQEMVMFEHGTFAATWAMGMIRALSATSRERVGKPTRAVVLRSGLDKNRNLSELCIVLLIIHSTALQ
jgi:hypothetical protein